MLLRNAVVILLGSNNVKETSVWICTKELHRKRVMREARLNAELGTWTEGRYSEDIGKLPKPGLDCTETGRALDASGLISQLGYRQLSTEDKGPA